MENQRSLLIHGSEDALSFVSECVEKYIQALLLLSEKERPGQEHQRNDPRTVLRYSLERVVNQPHLIKVTAREFLEKSVPAAVLDVFPEWEGILIEWPLLRETVWIVREQQNGQRLMQETGHPFVLFDDLLAQVEHLIQNTFLNAEHSEGEI
jgi:hypothetical protein